MICWCMWNYVGMKTHIAPNMYLILEIPHIRGMKFLDHNNFPTSMNITLFIHNQHVNLIILKNLSKNISKTNLINYFLENSSITCIIVLCLDTRNCFPSIYRLSEHVLSIFRTHQIQHYEDLVKYNKGVHDKNICDQCKSIL